MENKKEIMAYLAGVMDGDGSFSVGKLSNKSLNPLYFPLIQCRSWRPEYLDLLKDTFGGNFTTSKARHICKDGSPGNISKQWRLRGNKNCKYALESLIPYLRIKRDRAMHLLEFIENNPFIPGKPLTNEVLISRESSYLKAIKFNDWTSAHSSITTKLASSTTNNAVVLSYIAGLMDTDGSFSIKKQVKNSGTDVKNPRYSPTIQLSMTDARAINFIRNNCNLGKVYVPKNRDTNIGIHYHWSIYSKNEAIIFLEKILPFLRAKKVNALLLLEFCKTIKNTGYCKAGIPKDELEYREKCYKNLCHLNKNGVSKSPLIDLEPAAGNAGGDKAQAAKACSVNEVSEETPKGDAVL